MVTSTLYLCEKPSQARDIAGVLGACERTKHYLRGSGVTVTWCFGHLLEMAAPDGYGEQYRHWSLDTLPIIPRDWRLNIRPEVKAQYKAVEQLVGRAEHIVIATDADREGETIAREILERCRYAGPIDRLWLSALDEVSIRKALDNLRPGAETLPLYHAGLARARADWLVGMNLTRAYTVVAREHGHDRLLPVGRVQTPTLRLVVDRDQAIEAFTPVAYWEVLACLESAGGGRFAARWQPPRDVADDQGRCLSESAARTMAQHLTGAIGRVTRVETKRERAAPALPYDLGTLQQVASRLWDMGAQQVLETVQALYETHKAVTYPRTDCRCLPVSQHVEAGAVLKAIVDSDPEMSAAVDGAAPERQSKAWNDKKITAHHAIIPTASACETGRMSPQERRVYALIRARYIAQFYPDFEADCTVLTIHITGATFRASTRRIIVGGWKALEAAGDKREAEDAAENAALPDVQQGESCQVGDTEIQAKETRPPARYTEGTLIAAMKNVASLITDPKLRQVLRASAGLGTEATRAGIIQALIDRGFLLKRKKELVSSQAGRMLITILPRGITNPETTALWEQALDDISAGKMSLDAFVARQVKWVQAALEQVKSQGLNLPRIEEKTVQKRCPQCGRPMKRRAGTHGAFWGCTGYPECMATEQIGQKRRRTSPSRHAH